MSDLNGYNCPSCGANSNHKTALQERDATIEQLRAQVEKHNNEDLFNKYAEYVHICKVMRTEPKFNEWMSEQATELLESEK